MEIETTLKTLTVSETVPVKTIQNSKVMFYQIKLVPESYATILNFVSKYVPDIDTYKVNSQFHITTLFTGGKQDPREQELKQYLDKLYDVTVERVGITPNYISLGVRINDDTVPYYGNDVKHITVALKDFPATETSKGRKALPKDSFKALLENGCILLENTVTVQGVFCKGP